MTVPEIKNRFLNEYKDRDVKAIYKYNDDYLIIAPQKGLNEFNDFSDPTFLLETKTGKFRQFFPLDDYDGFSEAVRNGEVK